MSNLMLKLPKNSNLIVLWLQALINKLFCFFFRDAEIMRLKQEKKAGGAQGGGEQGATGGK